MVLRRRPDTMLGSTALIRQGGRDFHPGPATIVQLVLWTVQLFYDAFIVGNAPCLRNNRAVYTLGMNHFAPTHSGH
ncbi:hypothetical protein RSAG8_01047, partial [Rhizoctonia solani AG-8 WAC10335]